MTEQDRLALAEEAHDLAIHVQMCAMRHGQILSRIEQSDADARKWRKDADEAAKAFRARVEKSIWALIGMVGTGLGGAAIQVLPAMRAIAGQ